MSLHTPQWQYERPEWSADNTSVTATRVCSNDGEHVEMETVTANSEANIELTDDYNKLAGNLKIMKTIETTVSDFMTTLRLFEMTDAKESIVPVRMLLWIEAIS